MAHNAHLKISGESTICYRDIAEMWILRIAQDLAREAVEGEGQGKIEILLSQTLTREIDPAEAAAKLIQWLLKTSDQD